MKIIQIIPQEHTSFLKGLGDDGRVYSQNGSGWILSIKRSYEDINKVVYLDEDGKLVKAELKQPKIK